MSVLVVSTPAADLALLSIEKLRVAAGLADDDETHDEELTLVGLRAAAAISSDCSLVAGAGAAPTLRREELVETFRSVCSAQLQLSRRFDIEVDSLVVDDVAIDEDDFVVDPESGLVSRLSSDVEIGWRARKVVVTYSAGFDADEVPADLEQAAIDQVRFLWAERNRDPAVRGRDLDIPDVRRERTDYWAGTVPGHGAGPVPDVVAGRLTRFRNYFL